jgi:uncharacterized protein YciI
MSSERRFLVMFLPEREDFWSTITAEEGEVIRAHYEALVRLHDEGVLEFAGRDHGAKYGVAIFKVDSEEEVRTIMADNPALVAGLLRIEVNPYNLALDAKPS